MFQGIFQEEILFIRFIQVVKLKVFTSSKNPYFSQVGSLESWFLADLVMSLHHFSPSLDILSPRPPLRAMQSCPHKVPLPPPLMQPWDQSCDLYWLEIDCALNFLFPSEMMPRESYCGTLHDVTAPYSIPSWFISHNELALQDLLKIHHLRTGDFLKTGSWIRKFPMSNSERWTKSHLNRHCEALWVTHRVTADYRLEAQSNITQIRKKNGCQQNWTKVHAMVLYLNGQWCRVKQTTDLDMTLSPSGPDQSIFLTVNMRGKGCINSDRCRKMVVILTSKHWCRKW